MSPVMVKLLKVTYFKKGDKTPLADSPTDAGTYTFKIDVNEGDTTIQSIVYLHQNGNLSFQKHKHLQINQPLLQYPSHGHVRKSEMLRTVSRMTGNGMIPIFPKNCL